MKIRNVEATIKGKDEACQALLDSLVDVPEEFRVDNIPTWAGSFGAKRYLFHWLCKADKVRFFVMPDANGALHFKIEAPFFKGWGFSLTPELLYLISSIAQVTLNEMACDLTFLFRERRIFIPYELIHRLIYSLSTIALLYPERLASIHQAMISGGQPKDEEESEGKAKRVLH